MRIRLTLFFLIALGNLCHSQQDSLVDYFPLAPSARWDYMFWSNYYNSPSVYQADTGTVSYSVIYGTVAADSTLWHLSRHRVFTRDTFYRSGGSYHSMIEDSVAFTLVELHIGRHELYCPSFDSVDLFSFRRTFVDSTCFFRFGPVGVSSRSVNLSSLYPWYQSYRYTYVLRGDTGIIVSSSDISLEFNIGINSHYQLSSFGFSNEGYPGAKLMHPSGVSFTAAAGIVRDTSVIVTNVGVDTLVVSKVTSSDSILTARIAPAVIPPYQTAILSFHYGAASVRTTSAMVTITSNSLSSPDTIAVTVNNRALSIVSFTPRRLDFGSINVVYRHFDKPLTVTNQGTFPFVVDSVRTSDPEYAVITDGQPIAPGGSAVWKLRFTPMLPFFAWKAATIAIYTNALSSPDTIAANGYAYGARFNYVPGTLDFGEVGIGAAVVLPIRILYEGRASIGLKRIDPDNPQFSTPNPLFEPCDQCPPTQDLVHFRPTSAGRQTSYIVYQCLNGYDTAVDTVWLQGAGILDTVRTPQIFVLQQNYPNPFNSGTLLRYGLPADGLVELTVYDLLGKKVAILVNGFYQAGWHEAYFDARGLASGVYVARLTAGEFAQSRKMLLIR